MGLKRGKNNANRGGRKLLEDLNSKSVDREALSVNREVRTLIERSELVEDSKSRVVSVVVLRELLELLRD